METETPTTQASSPIDGQTIETSGGTAVTGDVNANEGDFIGHDKIIQEDEVYGDKVAGDKITTGDLTGNIGVAIGRDASVTIIHEALKPRLPLERPPRAAHFQDRKDDLAQLLADLHPGQVVTLCGPGGIGKTALAAEAVWQLAPGTEPPALFPNGILFHSFYNQSQAALALEHIARCFGEETKPTPKTAAQRALAGRRVLLILDGTEQADDLRLVLDIRDQCGVLITSRSRKDRVVARQDLKPLPLADAVTLLKAWGGQRAKKRGVAEQICQLVGRLPLAVCLVGGYLAQNEESASEYLAWLKETPFAALNQGKRQLESVPLLLKRSLAQVSERAHQVLEVVGLLALAPFDRAAIAEALAFSDRETLQALGELVNYGLLTRREEVYEVSHTLIHTYARQQLAPPDEIIVKLAAYYLRVFEAHKNDFAHLYPLRPHIITLISIASGRKIWDVVSSLARGIDDYLDLQGYWTDRITAITLDLGAVRAKKNRQVEGALLGNLGNVYRHLGQEELAINYYQNALAITEEIGDRISKGRQLRNLGHTYRLFGKTEQAMDYYQKALAIFKEIGDRRNEGASLDGLGNAYRDMGRTNESINYYQKALAIFKEIGDRRSEGASLGNLGNAYYALEQIEDAIACYQDALVIAREIGDRSNEGNQLGNLGNAFMNLGQLGQTIEYCQQSLAIAKEIGDPSNRGNQLINLGIAYHKSGQSDRAMQHWQEALQILEEIKLPNAKIACQLLKSLKK